MGAVRSYERGVCDHAKRQLVFNGQIVLLKIGIAHVRVRCGERAKVGQRTEASRGGLCLPLLLKWRSSRQKRGDRVPTSKTGERSIVGHRRAGSALICERREVERVLETPVSTAAYEVSFSPRSRES